MASVDPSRGRGGGVGKALLSHLNCFQCTEKWLGHFRPQEGGRVPNFLHQAVFINQNYQPFGSLLISQSPEDCADMPGAELLLDQTKYSFWLIGHDLSVWWCYWRRLEIGCFFDCSALWLVIPTQSNHENCSLKVLLPSTETGHKIQRQKQPCIIISRHI